MSLYLVRYNEQVKLSKYIFLNCNTCKYKLSYKCISVQYDHNEVTCLEHIIQQNRNVVIRNGAGLVHMGNRLSFELLVHCA